MTYEEYLALVEDVGYNNPEWRPGQTAFNVLHSTRPELAEAVRGRHDDFDPFHVQENLDRFYEYVQANWETAPRPTA